MKMNHEKFWAELALAHAKTVTEAVDLGRQAGVGVKEALEASKASRLDHSVATPPHNWHGAEWRYRLPCWAAKIVKTGVEMFSFVVATHCTWERCNGSEREPWRDPPALHPRVEIERRGRDLPYLIKVSTFHYCGCGACGARNFKAETEGFRQDVIPLVAPFLPLLIAGETRAILEEIGGEFEGHSNGNILCEIAHSLANRIQSPESWARIDYE